MKNALVMGSGRSGTSMLAGILHQAGYFLGEGLYPPHESNPRGFFECRDINAINEDLLASSVGKSGRRRRFSFSRHHTVHRPGRNQHWLLLMPPDGKVNPPGNEMDRRIRAMAEKSPFAYKDPRFSYTLPAWIDRVDRQCRFLCIFRDPGVTVHSILRECRSREYLKTMDINRGKGFRVWNRMYSSILQWHRLWSDRFFFVHYRQVLEGKRITELSDFLQADLQSDFADPILNRSQPQGRVPRESRRIYVELCEKAGFRPT